MLIKKNLGCFAEQHRISSLRITYSGHSLHHKGFHTKVESGFFNKKFSTKKISYRKRHRKRKGKELVLPSQCGFRIRSTWGNTIGSITDFEGKVLIWASGGTCGFKNTKKKTPMAARVVCKKLIKLIRRQKVFRLKISMAGWGWAKKTSKWTIKQAFKKRRRSRTPRPHHRRRPGRPPGPPRPRTNRRRRKHYVRVVGIRNKSPNPHNGCRPRKRRRIRRRTRSQKGTWRWKKKRKFGPRRRSLRPRKWKAKGITIIRPKIQRGSKKKKVE